MRSWGKRQTVLQNGRFVNRNFKIFWWKYKKLKENKDYTEEGTISRKDALKKHREGNFGETGNEEDDKDCFKSEKCGDKKWLH